MNTDERAPWQSLFPPPADPARQRSLEFFLLLKRGEPLLFVPVGRSMSAAALSLYPAQTRKARLARALMSVWLRTGVAPGVRRVTLAIDPQSPFIRFLREPARAIDDISFALLPGNPRAPGRRFILLVFDSAGRPVKVVKAGVEEKGRALIRHEAEFLRAARDRISAPAPLGEFSGDGIEALALEYIAGPTPPADDHAAVGTLLESWIDTQQTVRFSELPAARRLAALEPIDSLTRRVLADLKDATFHPAIFHGDFTPWNIRVEPGTKHRVVLDWERGELAGPPAWDWFHFVIQQGALVERLDPPLLLRRVNDLVGSEDFKRYAARAGIEPYLDSLLLAYVLYCRDVLRPAEGIKQVENLLKLLAVR